MIQLGGRTFELKYEIKNGWNFEAFRDRYSDVLDRYDYIVGDWGYNQLRLKGFFREGNPKGSKESSITSLQDYIQEYCNFGCAYFVLERIPNKKKADDAAEVVTVQQENDRKAYQDNSKREPNHKPSRRRTSYRHDAQRQERSKPPYKNSKNA